MKQRIFTAVLAGAAFIALVIIGDIPFVFLVYGLASIGLYELLKMKKLSLLSVPGTISLLFLWVLLYPYSIGNVTKIEVALLVALLLLSWTVLSKNRFSFDDVGFVLISTLYIGVGFYYLIETRFAGLPFVFFALFVVWATDTGAYFTGRAFGKKKLWPDISPNKTVEGSVGGVAFALLTAAIFQFVMPVHQSLLVVLFVAVCTSIFGQIGDLVESALKRHYIVKDSGHILPGHGGILDRFDSLLFVLPLLHFLRFL